MSEVHLQLPETLHQQLVERARREGVALHELIVESLIRTIVVPGLTEQKAAFADMLSRYPRDQAEEALRDLLASRE
jgi:hypothetical protein